MYPLFRRSATDLQGAALRVHITLTAGFVPAEDTHVDSDSQGELLSDEAEEADRAPSPSTPRNSQNRHKNKSRTTPDITSVQHTEMSADESFPVTVAVDRAMHLNLKGELDLKSFFFLLHPVLNRQNIKMMCVVFLWQVVL